MPHQPRLDLTGAIRFGVLHPAADIVLPVGLLPKHGATGELDCAGVLKRLLLQPPNLFPAQVSDVRADQRFRQAGLAEVSGR